MLRSNMLGEELSSCSTTSTRSSWLMERAAQSSSGRMPAEYASHIPSLRARISLRRMRTTANLTAEPVDVDGCQWTSAESTTAVFRRDGRTWTALDNFSGTVNSVGRPQCSYQRFGLPELAKVPQLVSIARQVDPTLLL